MLGSEVQQLLKWAGGDPFIKVVRYDQLHTLTLSEMRGKPEFSYSLTTYFWDPSLLLIFPSLTSWSASMVLQVPLRTWGGV